MLASITKRGRAWSRDPLAWLIGLAALSHLSSLAWGVPGVDSWANDSVAARDHLAGVALTLQPGNHFRYPLLHLLLLALLSLPAVLVALTQTGFGVGAPGFTKVFIAEIVKLPYMSWALVTGRVVTVLMSAVAMWAVYRIGATLWGRRAGLLSLAVLMTNAWFHYYSQTTNLDMPQLMWTLLAIERALAAVTCDAGDAARLRRAAGICAAFAVATKDQAAGVLLLGLPAVVGTGWLQRRGEHPSDARSLTAELRAWAPAVGVAAAVYLVACGALFNPTGYAARVQWLLGPASQEWTEYTADLAGRFALLWDMSWKMAMRAYVLPIGLFIAVAALGTLVAAIRTRKWLWALPVLLAASMTLLFNLGALRTSPRFLLAQTTLLALCGGWLLDGAWSVLTAGAGAVGRKVALTCATVVLLIGLSWSARVNVAMWTDARSDATSWLERHAPAGTRLEVYAKNFALPLIPSHLDAWRVRQTPLAKRNPISGLREVKAPFADIASRNPDLVLLVDKHYGTFLRDAAGAHRRHSKITQGRRNDRSATAHFRRLLAGRDDYRVVFRQQEARLWPWRPIFIHSSLSPTVVIVASKRWAGRFDGDRTSRSQRDSGRSNSGDGAKRRPAPSGR